MGLLQGMQKKEMGASSLGSILCHSQPSASSDMGQPEEMDRTGQGLSCPLFTSTAPQGSDPALCYLKSIFALRWSFDLARTLCCHLPSVLLLSSLLQHAEKQSRACFWDAVATHLPIPACEG